MSLANSNLLLPRSFVQRKAYAMIAERKRRAKELKRTVVNLLQQHYPEHLFQVEVQEDTGSILIDHPLLKNAGARYFCRYADYERSGGQAVVKLGGEILERAGINRTELMAYEEYDDARVVAATKTQFSAR
jgi:hypothetical protein